MILTGIGLFAAATLGYVAGKRTGFVVGARWADALWQRKFAQWNRTAQAARAQPPRGRVLFPTEQMDEEAAAIAVRLMKRLTGNS